MTARDPPHRRRRNARSRRHIHRPSHRGAPQQADPRFHSSCGAPRRAVRPRAAICQPGLPSSHGGATTARPCPRQPHLAGHLRLRRARIHTLNEQQGSRPVGVKRALACDIEPGVFSWALSLTPHSHRRLTPLRCYQLQCPVHLAARQPRIFLDGNHRDGTMEPLQEGAGVATDLGELQNKLWEAADQLRANSGLKASEYASPVLGLIFSEVCRRDGSPRPPRPWAWALLAVRSGPTTTKPQARCTCPSSPGSTRCSTCPRTPTSARP